MPTNFSRARVLLAAALLLAPARMLSAQEGAASPPPGQPADVAGARSVYTGDHTIEAGQTVDDVVVVGGDLHVRGTVTGDAVVVGGQLILEEAGLIEGDATVTGGGIVQNGGRIRGEMRMLDGGDGIEAQLGVGAAVAEARSDERETARERREEQRNEHRPFMGRAFRHIGDGVVGIISTLAFGLVLGGIGALLVFYGRPYLDTVSDTVRGSTLRSGAVGLAASFLVVPAFVVMVVAMAVSIIGIPFLLVAAPLYPLAVAAAAGMGLLASAHAIGERTSEQRNNGFDFRYRNAYAYLFTGLGMLLAPLLAANLIEMTGFLGFIGVLLKVATWAVIWAATTIGLGAVILSRAGTRRSFVPGQMDLGFETDPGFEPGPAPGSHV